MEKQIYGNITNTARTQFQFDRIYPNKREMDEFCDSDGIYAGRYILIEYGENPTRNATQLIERNGKFYYAKFPTVQVIPNGTENRPATITPGKLCYVKKDNTYIFYEPQNNPDKQFNEIYRYTSVSDNNYNANWNIDYDKYGRGFDSTVWQKIYQNGKEEYIMIAELNTVVPNFVMTLDSPSEMSEAPHFDEQSSDLNYNLHMPAQWDFRVKAAENGNSDEIIERIIKYDSEGNLLKEPRTEEIPADIFYNKDSFYPVYYQPVEMVTDEEEKYKPGFYYYIVENVWGLCQDEYNENLTFRKEIKVTSNPKNQFYYDTNNLTDVIELKKNDEINWENGKYYYILNYKYTIDVEEQPAEGRQYYKQSFKNNTLSYEPVDVSESYEKNTYYFLEANYMLDGALLNEKNEPQLDESGKIIIDENNDFNINIVYYEKVGSNYKPIELVNKPLYEKGLYYAWFQKYYTLDYSTERVPEKIYYYKDLDGEYKETKFLNRNYSKNTYYYLDENGNYLLDESETPIHEQYYDRILPVVKTGNDEILLLPTGSSGRLYNTHIQGEAAKAANDIQEISIHLPSIGRMMAEIWNLVYGKQRNELIYGSPIYNPNMYYENGEPRYQTGIGDLSNFVTIINQVNDLIGHNIIEIKNLESIQINSANGNVIIDGEVKDYIKVEDLEQYIYYIADSNKGEKGYYRLISTEIGINEYDLKLIKMSSFNNSIDTIYETLLNIQKALGTNETKENASATSIRGVLIKLQEILENHSKSLDFMTIGESLIYEKQLAWKDIYGTPLQQVYNRNTFVDVSVYKDDEECQKYYSHKLLTPYKKETVEAEKISIDSNNENYYRKLCGLKRFELKEITEDNFEKNKNNLYIYREIEKENNFRLLATEAIFDEEETYYVKKENVNTYESFDSYLVSNEQEVKICFDNEKDENGSYLADYSKFTVMTEEITTPLNGYYVIVLPYYTYWIMDENGIESKVTSDANIFTDIIEYNRYVIMHDNPRKSNLINNIDYNTTIELEKNAKNYSALAKIEVNKKGHIYSPNKENNQKELFVLPQAIVSINEPEDVPIGTLWYDINTNNS